MIEHMFDILQRETDLTADSGPDWSGVDLAAWDDADPAPITAVADDDSVPAHLEAMQPGLFLAVVLMSLDVSRLSGHDRIRVLRAHQRMVSYFQARLCADMASIPEYLVQEGESSPDLADEAAATEIRAALRLTRRAADSEMVFALDLQRRLPAVWDALMAGVIDVRRARVIVEDTMHVSVSTARAITEQLLEVAPRLTTGQLRARLRQLCVDVNPDDAKDRYESAVEQRRVVLQPTATGTAELVGMNLPADRATAAMAHVNRLARSLSGRTETRSMDQLRADVFLDLLTGRADEVDRKQAGVDLQVDLATLAGLSDASGDLAGFGPVIADVARQVAERQADGTWSWTVIDSDTGMPAATGTTRRRPTTAQRRQITARDRTCVFPGCRMPAIDCDIDHREPWHQGGPTTVANSGTLCRHDHGNKHRHGWTYQPISGGDYLWTSPLGHRYTTGGTPP